MSNLDIEIKELENNIAISIAIHIQYLKSNGFFWQQHLGTHSRVGN